MDHGVSKSSVVETAAARRSAAIVMDPRRLGALQPTRLSAARSLYSKLVREGWRIELVRADLDAVGAGRLLYRIEAGPHVLHCVAFSYEPKLVDRNPRIIGSSWDIEGALIDGEVSDAELDATQHEMPRLYAGRATPETLIWFRANRSIRLFEHVRERLAAGAQPDPERLDEVGYLLRNTGLDGNGTFGTKDFQNYGTDHPLAVPYHAQLFTAYLMREISVDLVEHLSRLDATGAARLDASSRDRIAVGNGSALGLVLLAMNRPHLVDAWIGGYEELLADVRSRPIEATSWSAIDAMLGEAIAYRDGDDTPYGVFPSGELVAADLRLVRRMLAGTAAREDAEPTTWAAFVDRLPTTTSPEAVETLHSLLLELVPQADVDRTLAALRVDERKQVDPTQTVGALRDTIDARFGWVREHAFASDEHRGRVWYKSRNSEEPRCGPGAEVPSGTHDLAVNVPAELRALRAVLDDVPAAVRVGAFVAAHPTAEQIVGYVQRLSDRPYAIPRADVHDDGFVPAHLIRLFNAFCFGLDKTRDVLQRNLRGLIFEGANFRGDLAEPGRDWRWTNATGVRDGDA